jgi:hypothetical protein
MHSLDTVSAHISEADLVSVVRQALGRDALIVTSWTSRQIHGGAGFGSSGGSAIHRFSGEGRDQEEPVVWSVILKVLYPPADRGQPSDSNYWRREAHAFESGLLEDLDGRFTAPRCFGVVDQPDGACWIWLEDVQEGIKGRWPLEHYGVVARHLGRFNGAYLTGTPLPSYPYTLKVEDVSVPVLIPYLYRC